MVQNRERASFAALGNTAGPTTKRQYRTLLLAVLFFSGEDPCSLSLQMEETATPGSYGELVLSSPQQFWTVKKKGRNELAVQSQQVAVEKGRDKMVCGLTSAPTVRQNRPPTAASWIPGPVLQQGGRRSSGWDYSLPAMMEQSVCEPDLEVDSEVQPNTVVMQETSGH